MRFPSGEQQKLHVLCAAVIKRGASQGESPFLEGPLHLFSAGS